MTYGKFIEGTYTHPVTEAALAELEHQENPQGHDMLHTCLSTPEFVAAISPRGIGFEEPLGSLYRETMQNVLHANYGVGGETAYKTVLDAEATIAAARKDERRTRRVAVAKKIFTLGFADVEIR